MESRSRLRYLLHITFLGCVSGLIFIAIAPFVQQRLAIRKVEALGGGVLCDDKVPMWVSEISPYAASLLGEVWDADFGGTQVDDQDVVCLRALPHLRAISLRDTIITNATIQELTRFSKLNSLVLDGTKITDDALLDIAKMPRLQVLRMCNTRISDRGVRGLVLSSDLRHLYLNDTRITDLAIDSLAKLKMLEVLEVYDTDISYSGMLSLRYCLPKCSVRWNRRDLPATEVR